jgi:NFU1 iron-sulfur cluster scaffold homolog, mitochondrial
MEWDVVKPEVYAAIMDHFSTSKPLFNDPESEHGGSSIREDDSEVVQMIKELLETRIRPAVAEDGGDVLFVSFDEDSGRVTLKMQGACSGCPSSSVTLKSGIEQMMKHYITEVQEVVEAPADEVELESQKQLEKLEKHLSP